MAARITQVELFIREFRECWPPKCHVVNTEKNIQALADLNLTARQRREIILHLTPADYIKGPLEDKDRGGENIWIFSKEVQGQQVYIKLKLFEAKGHFFGKCISFHPAEWPMDNPFS